MDHVARALGCSRRVEIPEAARARASAYLITAAEGAALHLDRLRTRASDFDPAVRDRLIAGAMLPAPSSSGRSGSGDGTAPPCSSCSARST
ncbi:hypothetical protein ACFQWF_15930 [Methylorubrum suomiense]